jgi:hypothetical protein
MTVEEVLNEARQLPRDQKAMLSMALWQEVVHPDAAVGFTQEECAALDEISRRMDVEPGYAIPIDDALAKIRAMFRT